MGRVSALRTAVAVAAAALFAAGCNCGQGSTTEDGGTDAGVDAGVDAGTDAGWDAGSDAGMPSDAGGVPLPLYRVGLRTSLQGLFGPQQIAGSISMPVTANTPAGFSDWSITSQAAEGAVTFMNARDDGGMRGVDLAGDVSTASSAPQAAREIFTARSADGGTVLLTVLDAQRELHFTIESTALQALALAEVRSTNPFFAEDYFTGARPGDRPELDAHVAAVAAAMKLRLAADGKTGLSVHGFAFPTGLVFDVIDGARATPGVPRPVVTAGASSLHVTEVALSGAEGTLALWLGSNPPQPAITIPAGITRVGLFLYTVGQRTEPLYVKFAASDGGQSQASARFGLPEPLGTGPAEPTLDFDGGVAVACGLTAGNHVVFFSTATELAVGFAGAQVAPGMTCMELRASEIPSQVGLLNAAQVAPDGRVGGPSNIVFP